MGKPYSQDLRERVIATVDAGTRVCATARCSWSAYPTCPRSLAVGERPVRRRRVWAEPDASRARTSRRSHSRPRAAHPHARSRSCRSAADECKVKVSIGCLWNRPKFLKLPLKKSHCALPNRIGPISPRPAICACQPARTAVGTPRLHRRNRCGDRHGAPLRPLSARRAPRFAACRGDIGKRPPSLPHCGSARSPRPVCWTDLWMAKLSRLCPTVPRPHP